MNRDNGLKPCPFCGNVVRMENNIFGFTDFQCEKCGAIVSFKGSEAKDKAIKSWNRRTYNENTKSCNDEHKS